MIKVRQILLLFMFLSAVSLFGQAGRKYSNAFLSIGVDARAMGMSNSIVASVDDASAGYWNPAGLANMGHAFDFGLMHAEYFASIAQYDYLAGAMDIDENQSVGFTLIRFGVDNILNTTQLIDQNGNVDYNRITKFSAADYAFMGSYARKIPSIKGLTVGANMKIVYRQIGDFADAYGFGIDAGAQYRPGKWRFGVTLRDITTTVNSWVFNTDDLEEVFEDTGNELPQNGIELTIPRMLFGAGRVWEFSEKFTMLSEVDLDFTFDGQRSTLVSSSAVNINPSAGLEFAYSNFVFVRAGIGQFQRIPNIDGIEEMNFQPTLGVGFKYRGISVDYALTDVGNTSAALYSNIFSLKYRFNRK